MEHETLGPLTLSGPPLRLLDRTGLEVTRNAHTAPTTVDANGEDVRRWAGGTS